MDAQEPLLRWCHSEANVAEARQQSARLAAQISSITGLANCVGSRLHELQETQAGEESEPVKIIVMDGSGTGSFTNTKGSKLRDGCLDGQDRPQLWYFSGYWIEFFLVTVFLPCKKSVTNFDRTRDSMESNCEQFKFRSSGEQIQFFLVQHSMTLSLNIFNRVLYPVTLLVNLQCSDHVYDDCLQLNPVTTFQSICTEVHP